MKILQTNCPYSIEEILEIYKTLRLEIDSSSLTDEEFRDETRSVVGNPGRFITSNTCENLCQRHKKKNRYIKPRHCANFFSKLPTVTVALRFLTCSNDFVIKRITKSWDSNQSNSPVIMNIVYTIPVNLIHST